MKILGINTAILPEIATMNAISPIAGMAQLDGLLSRHANYVQPDKISPEAYIKVVTFAVVKHRNTILVALQEGVPVLGFGRVCHFSQERAGQSMTGLIIEELYGELDRYIPATSYSCRLSGLILCDDRPYDRNSLGIMFIADLAAPIEAKTVAGKPILLCDANGIDEGALRGWSRLIYDKWYSCAHTGR